MSRTLLCLLPLVLSYNTGSQISLGSEDFSVPTCEKAPECVSCSFHEVRTLDECRVSGYFQTTPCQMMDLRTNATKVVTYISACSPEYLSILSPFSWFQVVMFAAAVWFLRAWSHLRKEQRASYELKLKKIISMCRSLSKSMGESFLRLGVTKSYIQDALTYFHFEEPSPVQTASIPQILAGHNLLVQGKNGTGKTLAFTCSLLQLLDDFDLRAQVLILAPTREIAAQTFDFINEMTFTAPTPIYTSLSVGGTQVKDNIRCIEEGCHIVIGTPGRVMDLMKRKKLDLKSVKIVVMDEADELTRFEEIGKICMSFPANCQLIAFSATYSQNSAKILQSYFNSAIWIKADGDEVKLRNLKEYFLICRPEIKTQSLISSLKSIDFHQAIVFYNVKSKGEQLATDLRNAGFPCLFVSGDMIQQQRIEAIRALRFLGIRVLLSTDLTSRGIDVLNVNLTVNFDLPQSKQVYVHRVGRAGRYGTPGIALTLLTQGELPTLQDYSEVSDFATYTKNEVHLQELLPEEQEKFAVLTSTTPVEDEGEATLRSPTELRQSQDAQKKCQNALIASEAKSSPKEPITSESVQATPGNVTQPCALCSSHKSDLHCHCSTCIINYRYILSYMTPFSL